MEINEVHIEFNADTSVGIPQEFFKMELPLYDYDEDEVLELAKNIRKIYEDFADTYMNIWFKHNKDNRLYFENGKECK